MLIFVLNKKVGLCKVKFCSNGARKYKNRSKTGKVQFAKMCHKHLRQHQKENNPIRYWFDVLRQNARRRKIKFGLTIADFKEFCDETGYLKQKGKNPHSWTIDRKRPHLGYVKGNIQILTHAGNCRKRYIDEKIDRLMYGDYGSEENYNAALELDEAWTASEDLRKDIVELNTNEDDEQEF